MNPSSIIRGVLFVLLGLSTLSLWGQMQVKGRVVDSLEQPISFALLVVKNPAANQILTSTSTDGAGDFSLSIPAPGNYLLEARRLGYATIQRPLVVSPGQARLEIRITLPDIAYTLDEFVVRDTRIKMQKQQDTVTINADAFADGTEIVIEDLLKKIPGIEVSESGAISVRGQSIERVMIEGDDLFEKGYAVLTKNIQADLIDKIQVLNRFSSNAMLKDVLDSDQVALNLLLKEDRKVPLTGNIEGGLSPLLDRHSTRVNLISIRKKTKHFLFGNVNTTGENPTGDIANLLYSSSSVPGEDYQARNLVQVQGAQAPLADIRANLNQTAFGSLSSIFRPLDKVKIKSLLFGKHDVTEYANVTVRDYLPALADFSFTNQFDARERNNEAFARLSTEIAVSETASLEGSYKYTLQQANSQAQRLFNQVAATETLANHAVSGDLQIQYTQKLSAGRALEIKGRYWTDRKPQDYLLDGTIYPIPNQDSRWADQVQQTSENGIAFAGLEATYYQKSKAWHHTGKAGFNYLQDNLSSGLIFQDQGKYAPWPAADNQEKYSISDQFIKWRTKYSIGKISLLAATQLRLVHYQLSTREQGERSTAFNVQPAVELTYTPNDRHELQLMYAYTQRDLGHETLYRSWLLAEFNRFNRSQVRQFQLPGHALLGKYVFGEWGQNFQGHASFFYNYAPEYIGTNYWFTSSFVETEFIPLQNQHLYSTQLTAEQFFPFCKLNLNISYELNYSHFQNSIPPEQLVDLVNTANAFNVEIRSGFGGFLNFHAGINQRYNSLSGGASTQTVQQLLFLDIQLRLTKNLLLQWKNERLQNRQDQQRPVVYGFADLDLRYSPRNSPASFRLIARNLLNVREFQTFRVADSFLEAQSFGVIGRYVLLQFNMRL